MTNVRESGAACRALYLACMAFVQPHSASKVRYWRRMSACEWKVALSSRSVRPVDKHQLGSERSRTMSGAAAAALLASIGEHRCSSVHKCELAFMKHRERRPQGTHEVASPDSIAVCAPAVSGRAIVFSVV
jgi:hypothetical protein